MSKSAARRKRNSQHSGQQGSQAAQATAQPAQPTGKSPQSNGKSAQAAYKSRQAARQAAKQAPARKVHGPWLTALLVWIGLDGLLSLVLLFAYRQQIDAVRYPWLMGAAVLVALATIGSAVALWFWKRWGLYLFLAATAGSIALGLIALWPTPAMVVAFHAIIPLALLGYVLNYQKKMPLLA